MSDQLLGTLLLLGIAVVLIFGPVMLINAFGKRRRRPSRWPPILVGGTMLLGGLASLLAAIPASERADEFREEARERTGVVREIEERRIHSGSTSRTEWIFHVAVTEDDGSERVFELEGLLSNASPGEEVRLWVLGDEVHWDPEFSPWWDGPVRRVVVGCVLLLFGAVILVPALRQRRR